MNLKYLCATPTVAVYYDSCNNWLFLDWEGEMTLQSAKRDASVIVRCFIGHNYSRILSSNTHLTSVAWDVADWLTHSVAAFVSVAGIKQLAWVYAPSLSGRGMAEKVMQHLSQEMPLALALFVDMEQAVSWLQQTSPDYPSGCAVLARPANIEAQLMQFIKKVDEQLHPLAVAG